MIYRTIRAVWFIVLGLLIFVACGEHIVQRAVGDYFRYDEGNWWQLIGASDTLYIEVEPVDTILQQEVIPVSYNGVARFILDVDEALLEHVSVEYTFSGSPFTVINDFMTLFELPFVNGNTWHDSVIDSIDVSGQIIKARYDRWGTVTGCIYNEVHDGDVYTIEFMTMLSITTPDTIIVDSTGILEEYAPGKGIVRFRNEIDDYRLSDYYLVP